MIKKHILFLLSVFFINFHANGQSHTGPIKFIVDSPKATVLVVGVFHFDNPGLDDYKPEYQMDILSNERQAEIRELVSKLEDFRPTKIGLEFKNTAQIRMDSLYNRYRESHFELPANEIYQLGFRLAAQSGLQRVYGIDAPGENYPSISSLTEEEYQHKAAGYTRLGLTEKPNTTIWYPKYQELYQFEDSLKMVIPLEEYLLYLNSSERTEIGHGQYLVDSFKFGIGREGDYFGADMKTRWYNRNLRILQNIYRIIDSAEDRVLIIIGAGHLPILKHVIKSSPELEWVEIADYFE